MADAVGVGAGGGASSVFGCCYRGFISGGEGNGRWALSPHNLEIFRIFPSFLRS